MRKIYILFVLLFILNSKVYLVEVLFINFIYIEYNNILTLSLIELD